MAQKTKKKTTQSSTKRKINPTKVMFKKSIGLAMLIVGIIISISIISYCFTWKTDQDAVLNQNNWLGFILNNKIKVDNIGGSIGAFLSHKLVYEGFGIASIAIGVWLIYWAQRLLTSTKSPKIGVYLRWTTVTLLLLAPTLTYLFPSHQFPYGGAFGQWSISTLNAAIGKIGTGLVLLGLILFFTFIIAALDIRPLLRRAQSTASKVGTGISNASTVIVDASETVQERINAIKERLAESQEKNQEPENEELSFLSETKTNNDNKADKQDPLPLSSLSIDEEISGKTYNMTLSEQEPTLEEILNSAQNIIDSPVSETHEEPKDELEDAYAKWLENGISNSNITEANTEASEINAISDETNTIHNNITESAHVTPIDSNIESTENTANNTPSEDQKNASSIELSVENFDSKTAKQETKEEPEFTFEVKIEEEITSPVEKQLLHGSHISIQDNEPYDPENDLPDYKFPTLDLLEDRNSDTTVALDKDELEKNKSQILSTLKSFGIDIARISAVVGPTVTLYEIVPAEGVRISKIRNLEDDIALNLAALGIRIIAPIPGRGTIGIEVPNANKQMVSMKTLLASEKFVNNKMSLPIALGKKIDNENYIVDLATMPHLLVAGATGQGKSVGINAILVSLLYKKHPSQLKFVMVDPKIVELSIYRLIEKHYLAKLPDETEAIITDTKKVINTLNSLCIEMDNRYELLKDANTRNIKEYNEKFVKRKLNPLNGHKYLPFIVLVIDEFADLIMTAGKEIEMPIARLAQKARAVGMHIIVATQRPSVNVITGVIKANFPARIAFKVSSKIDSRTILDTGGAEQLIGRGDMLISHGSELLRLQCAFVDTPEVENIVEFIGNQRGYPSAFELPEYESEEGEEKIVDLTNRDKLFEECARLVVQTGNGSTSNLQRRFNLGYNRAGRIMDQLEASGIVGGAQGSKPREVLFKSEMELDQFLESLH